MVFYQKRIFVCEECADISSIWDGLNNDILEMAWEDIKTPSSMEACDICGQDYICTAWIAEFSTREEN